MENKRLYRALKYIAAAAICIGFIIAADTTYAKPGLSRKLIIVEKGAKYRLGKIVKGQGKLTYKSRKREWLQLTKMEYCVPKRPARLSYR